jgi:hypothetical protein
VPILKVKYRNFIDMGSICDIMFSEKGGCRTHIKYPISVFICK